MTETAIHYCGRVGGNFSRVKTQAGPQVSPCGICCAHWGVIVSEHFGLPISVTIIQLFHIDMLKFATASM
jgi:hypothetical protein